MRLTDNDDMIQALAADRPDQPFGKSILPRRGWGGRLVPDTHGAQSACDDGTLALQLPFMKISESMGNHDSKIVDAGSVG